MARRGGYRKPSKPAAVSGPGALSARTDGGPSAGSYKTTGLPYGDNKAVNDMQSAAPMPGAGGGGAGSSGGAPAGGGRASVFAPTDRPGEPITAGTDFGPGAGMEPQMVPADDPYYLIRAAIANYPHLYDQLIGLLDGR